MIHIIENDFIKAYICEYGAILSRLIDKKTNIDLVLGFETEEDYIEDNGSYIGTSVGRNANRIGKSQFVLDGVTYKISCNDSVNQLHGGIVGFSHKMWEVKECNDTSITLKYFSKDGEEGFPGNLNVEVTYKIDGNSLTWSYSGTSDKDTILNMTNHSYFCLGDDNILNQTLHLTTDKYSPTDENCLTQADALNTIGTPYDFSKETRFEDNLKNLSEGIDNNYVWEIMGDKLMAELKNDKLQLNVYSDLPDMHLYTAYHLNTEKGKYNRKYGKYSAACLECQYYPNGINYGSYIKPILRKGETMNHYIRYEIISK